MRAVAIFTLAFGFPLGLGQSTLAENSNVKAEWKTCAGTSTIKTDKNVCYVVDLKTGDKKMVIELCAGVNLSAGTIIFGGRTSTMLCSTVEVPVGENKEATIKQAEKALREKLQEPAVQKALQEKLGKTEKIKAIGPINIKEDPTCVKLLVEAAKKAR